MTSSFKKVWVVVPMLNEEKLVEGTCEALLAQNRTGFSVLFVDNGSTDSTVYAVEKFIVDNNLRRWHIIFEPQKGTGAASDTGVREAISRGATVIARTDSDCIPSPDWLEVAVTSLQEGVKLVAGRMTTRTDDVEVSFLEERLLNFLPVIARTFGRLRPSNRGAEYKGKYMMVAGCNVAFTSSIYTESGGFPRTKIEEAHEDRGLINNVRRHTDKYSYNKHMTVAMSARRVKKWGVLNTLKWYKNHGYKPEQVDIR